MHSLVKMEDEGEEGEAKKSNGQYTPADFFVPLESLSTNEKIRSVAFDDVSPSRYLMIATGSNSVLIYKVCTMYACEGACVGACVCACVPVCVCVR